MNALTFALRLALKDLRIEARTGEIVLTTALFGVLVTVISSLAFYLDETRSAAIAPGVLWIALAFAGVMAMGRSWARERENDALRALLLSPIPRASIYLGKALGVLLFMLIVSAVLAPLVAILFALEPSLFLVRALPVLLLGVFGFVATGTLFSAMSVRTRARDLVLSVVLFPLISPALLAGVVATREILGGAPWEATIGWIRILAAFDLIALFSGVVLFEPLIRE